VEESTDGMLDLAVGSTTCLGSMLATNRSVEKDAYPCSAAQDNIAAIGGRIGK
jgi:hypothetical protein